MYHASFAGFGEAKAGSAFVRKFQSALAAVGYSPSATVGGSGGIDGTWGPYTRVAMNKYQAAKGLSVTEFPSIETMQKLGIPPADWPMTVSDAGGYTALVNAATKAAADYATAEPAPETMPEVPPAVVPAAGGGATTVAPVMTSMVGVWPWFKRNWKWFAVGGGLGAVGLTAVLLSTKKSVAPASVPAMGDQARGPASHEFLAKMFSKRASRARKAGYTVAAAHWAQQAEYEREQLKWHKHPTHAVRGLGDGGRDWWSAGNRWLQDVARKEGEAQLQAHVKRGRSKKTFRYNPPAWHRVMMDMLGKNDEEGFKRLKMRYMSGMPMDVY